MYPVSSAFVATLKQSHTMVTKCELWTGLGTYIMDLDIYGGQVNVQDSAIRRYTQMELGDPSGDLTPASATDLLAPYGNEFRVFRGLVLSTGTEELVPLGRFPVSSFVLYDSGGGFTIVLYGSDYARSVGRAKLPNDYQIAAGTNFGTAIQSLISYRRPSTVFNFESIVATTPTMVISAGADPWEQAQKMAEACGCELFFDVLGVCTLKSVPDPDADDPIWTYDEGSEATILYLDKHMTNDDTFNHVVRTGEHTSNSVPVRGEAVDDNPTSPTYYLGPYGDVVDYQSSQLITTSGQALAAAQADLNKSKGAVEDVSFNAIVNPAHDIDDVIAIKRAFSKIDNTYVIDRITVPLTPDASMSVSTRSRTVS